MKMQYVLREIPEKFNAKGGYNGHFVNQKQLDAKAVVEEAIAMDYVPAYSPAQVKGCALGLLESMLAGVARDGNPRCVDGFFKVSPVLKGRFAKADSSYDPKVNSVAVNVQLLHELLAGAYPREHDRYVDVGLVSGLSNHVLREVEYAHRLAHVEGVYRLFAPARRLQHEPYGLVNRHEIALHARMRHGHREPLLYLFLEERHDRAGRPEDVPEAHGAKRSGGVGKTTGPVWSSL